MPTEAQNLDECKPGKPFKASTSKPESSAITGNLTTPEKAFALIYEFSK